MKNLWSGVKMFKFIMKKEKKPKGFAIYFTDKELNDHHIKAVLLRLVDMRLHRQFV